MSEIETTVAETGTAAEAPVPGRDFDAEAREIGWVPQEDFKGPAEKWKPAQQFVEDGERILPIVRAQLKAEREKVAKSEAEFQKRIERIERVSQTALDAQKRQHEAELARLASERRQAVEAGDVKEFDRLSGDMEKLERTAPTVESPPANDVASEIAAFERDNPWFTTDFDMHTTAVNYSNWLAKQKPDMSFKDNSAATIEYMKGKFPDKFGGAKPNGFSAVDGGGSFPGAKPKPNSASSLPAEARAAGERYVKQGLYKDLEAYAKEYFNG